MGPFNVYMGWGYSAGPLNVYMGWDYSAGPFNVYRPIKIRPLAATHTRPLIQDWLEKRKLAISNWFSRKSIIVKQNKRQ